MSYLLLLVILAMGVLARSKLVAIAAGALILLRFLGLDRIFELLSKKGIKLGLLLLILTVMVPMATDRVSFQDLKKTFTTFSGLAAMVGGLLATKFNGMGLDLLEKQPQLVIGMVFGAIVGIVFWGGIPVGPLMAGGLTAIIIKIIDLF